MNVDKTVSVLDPAPIPLRGVDFDFTNSHFPSTSQEQAAFWWRRLMLAPRKSRRLTGSGFIKGTNEHAFGRCYSLSFDAPQFISDVQSRLNQRQASHFPSAVDSDKKDAVSQHISAALAQVLLLAALILLPKKLPAAVYFWLCNNVNSTQNQQRQRGIRRCSIVSAVLTRQRKSQLGQIWGEKFKFYISSIHWRIVTLVSRVHYSLNSCNNLRWVTCGTCGESEGGRKRLDSKATHLGPLKSHTNNL